MNLFNSDAESVGSCGTNTGLVGGRRRKSHRHRRKSHRRKSHRRVRRGGAGALSKLVVPASLYALKQLMAKRSSRKFVKKLDKSLGRPGKTVIKDVTKGVVGTVNMTSRVLGLKKKRKSRGRKSSRRKSSRRKSRGRKSRRRKSSRRKSRR